MDKTDFDYDFYLVTLRTADAVGMAVVNKDDLARVMAIILHEGGNEQFTYSYKLKVEMQFAQEKYHIKGGETPDPRFVLLLQRYIREIEIYQEQHKGGYPDWAVTLMKDRYGISKKLYVSDPDRRISRSEKTDNFANEIIPDINLCDPDKAEIYVASISQVKMLESRLRDVSYELKDGQMKKIDGNKE